MKSADERSLCLERVWCLVAAHPHGDGAVDDEGVVGNGDDAQGVLRCGGLDVALVRAVADGVHVAFGIDDGDFIPIEVDEVFRPLVAIDKVEQRIFSGGKGGHEGAKKDARRALDEAVRLGGQPVLLCFELFGKSEDRRLLRDARDEVFDVLGYEH